MFCYLYKYFNLTYNLFDTMNIIYYFIQNIILFILLFNRLSLI